MQATNPVLRGFAPDPSMIRVGEWYYLATSSFEWFPTIPLHRSHDLVHWHYAGCVETAVPGQSLLGVPDSGGIWAPALSYANGLFWVVYSIVRSVGTQYFDLETYLCTASDVSGPWSAPVRVPGHGFDPSLFHYDGKHYLANLYNDCRAGGNRFAGIIVTELDLPWEGHAVDLNGIRPIGPTHLLLQHHTLLEGPKILVKDGWFYLVLAEGGTGVKHGVRVARSRSLCGPYELDPVPLLTTRDDPSIPLQKAGHGELVQTPTGEWILAHLASRPVPTTHGPRNPLGRETAIQPVVWVDGWPRLAHGGWHPMVEVALPGGGDDLGDDVALERGFGALPGWPWSALRQPIGEWLDTAPRPGWIRVRGQQGPQSLWEQSLLAQRLTEHKAQVEVTVDASPSTFTESAGLVLWYNTSSFYRLHLTWAEPEGEVQTGQQWLGRGRRVVQLEHRYPDGARVLADVDAPAGPVRLRAQVSGDTASFAIELNGCFQPIGPSVDFSELSDDFGPALRFTGAFAGVSVVDLVGGGFTADFADWQVQETSSPPWTAPS